jgi:probable phosphoglycerate mutase
MPKMLTIYLARHGQDEDNAAGILNGHRDRPLTELGVHQAKELATKIKSSDLKFDAIYSSPLQRASKTADIIVAAEEEVEEEGIVDDDGPAQHAVERLDDLIERDFGVMTGVPVTEIESRCSPDVYKTDTVTYFLSPPGAETFPQLLDRARRLLDTLVTEKHNNDNHQKDVSILLVTHGDFGKMFYANYYNLEWKNVLKDFHFGNSEVIVCSPTIKNRSSSSSGGGPDPKETHVFTTQQFNA